LKRSDEPSVEDAQEVLDALGAAIEDPRFLKKLIVHAASLLSGYATMGLAVPTGTSAARALVSDAISDTTMGALGEAGPGARVWKPRDTPLLHHLKRVISNRVRNLKNRASKFEGHLPDHEMAGGSFLEPTASDDVEASVAARDLAAKRIACLMAIAEERGYENAYYVLMAIKDGHRGTTNIMVAAGFSSPGEIYRAQGKIRKLLGELPSDLGGHDDSRE